MQKAAWPIFIGGLMVGMLATLLQIMRNGAQPLLIILGVAGLVSGLVLAWVMSRKPYG